MTQRVPVPAQLRAKIAVCAEVPLMAAIDGLDDATAMVLIKYIDRNQDDWDFTQRAAAYFQRRLDTLARHG